MTVCVSISKLSLVFLIGTFRTKGAKYLARVKGLPDVLRSGQDNQRERITTRTNLSAIVPCPDFGPFDFSADGLGQFFYILDDSRVFIGCRDFLYKVLKLPGQGVGR